MDDWNLDFYPSSAVSTINFCNKFDIIDLGEIDRNDIDSGPWKFYYNFNDYDIADLNQSKWDELITELQKRGIKETTFTDGSTPKDNYYGRQGIFDLVKSPGGRDIHHDVMKFLEESGLYLLCHVTSDEFNQMLKDTNPEGHDSCGDAGIVSKITFWIFWQPDVPSKTPLIVNKSDNIWINIITSS